MNEEFVGKVKLDLSLYPGSDLYCDGDSEDRLLEAVSALSGDALVSYMEENPEWEIFYHLSHLRENIVEWLPSDKAAKVLEVGSGCGAISGALVRKYGSVTCVELSKKRSLINANRHKDADNMEIKVGNFEDIEPSLPCDYDVVFLIGVLEYSGLYIHNDHPYSEMLKVIKKHLKPEGHIVIAIENRLGLKYFAGCAEDHNGRFFDGIEGYRKGGAARTFSKPVLEKILDEAGINERRFFYPYPDYKFMKTLFSEARLPKAGELRTNVPNPDRDRLTLFNEERAAMSLNDDGLYPLFADSFLIVTGTDDTLPDYVRFSADRREDARISTEICRKDEKTIVRKRALSEKSDAHINRMMEVQDALAESLAPGFELLKGSKTEASGRAAVAFEYLDTETLEDKLDEKIDADDRTGFLSLVSEAFDRFGRIKSSPADADPAFSNIFIKDEKWIITDHEWISEKASGRDLFVRAMYCYLLEDEGRRGEFCKAAFEKIGITYEDTAHIRKSEASFQKAVTGGHLSFGEICERIGRKSFGTERLNEGSSAKELVQIYTDKGRGFNEEDSFTLLPTEKDGKYLIEIKDIRGAFRFDPGFLPCMIKICSLKCGKKEYSDPVQISKLFKNKNNAVACLSGVFIFDTEDPNITMESEGDVSISFERTFITAETAGALASGSRRRLF